ncbi:unnamed protein product [Phaedon cochleariae]|uniref:Uncharacterized protein n=1 Tax=Phaedon cochleariae TaxID=80249 RepID=A0A9P0D9U8_PHACE|nr:unnamed protein product [Phaedon cochleariae]
MVTKTVIVLCTIISTICARPQGTNNDPRLPYITRYDFDSDHRGNFIYNVDTSDGTHVDQVGEILKPDTPEEENTVYGHYSYVGPDGVTYIVEYIAGKNGFQVAGDHIPMSAGVARVGQLGIPSAALASLAGGGLG